MFIEYLAEQLHIGPEKLDQIVKQARHRAKKLILPKKSGGIRTVWQPANSTKMVQYWLMNNVLKAFPVHSSAMAYKRKISILDNAKAHKGQYFFLRMDMKDFFPSIKFDDLKRVFSENYNLLPDVASKYINEFQHIVSMTCFGHHDELRIGYPSSPAISNLVMYQFDVLFDQFLREEGLQIAFKYTRYADDITISCNEKGALIKNYEKVKKFIETFPSPKLRVNLKKTKFGSRGKGTAIVTGLRFTSDRRIVVPRKKKDEVRLLLNLLDKNKLDLEEIPKLKGWLAFIQNVEGEYHSKLVLKYFDAYKRLFQDSDNESLT